MREIIFNQREILLQFEKMENKLTKHDEDITLIFQYLKKLTKATQIILSVKTADGSGPLSQMTKIHTFVTSVDMIMKKMNLIM